MSKIEGMLINEVRSSLVLTPCGDTKKKPYLPSSVEAEAYEDKLVSTEKNQSEKVIRFNFSKPSQAHLLWVQI
jgi:hypothetical protein